MDRAKKGKLITKHQAHEKDTGSAQVQVAILTKRINELTKHLKTHAKDNHSRRGLIKMVGKRRKLLEYLKNKNADEYNKLIDELKIRR